MKTQLINNKNYIELDVLLLHTTDKTKLWLNTISNQLHYTEKEKVTHHKAVNQHIYFLSNNPFKENDWCYDIILNIVFKLDKFSDFEYFNDNQRIKKVEAATDSSLGYEDFITIKQRKGLSNTYPTFKPIPQIPQQFIKHFITEFNKGNIITKVKVEVEKKIIGETPIPFGYENIYSNDSEIAINNVNNEVIPLIDILEFTPFHKPDFSHLKVKTAVDWLINELDLDNNPWNMKRINQAKEIEEQQIINAYRTGFLSEDIKLAEDYYNEKFE